jgi:hypothetical protein
LLFIAVAFASLASALPQVRDARPGIRETRAR